MNVRIPVPRPDVEAGDTPSRGGIDAEELRRIQLRAERYVTEQAANADATLALREEDRRMGVARQSEIFEARAIIARSETLRAEGNLRLAVSVAAGTVAGIVVGLVFAERRRS